MSFLPSPAAVIFADLTVYTQRDRSKPDFDHLLQSDKASDFKRKFLLKESVDLKLISVLDESPSSARICKSERLHNSRRRWAKFTCI